MNVYTFLITLSLPLFIYTITSCSTLNNSDVEQSPHLTSVSTEISSKTPSPPPVNLSLASAKTPSPMPTETPIVQPTVIPAPTVSYGWTTYTSKDGLAHNKVRAIAIDKANHLWFGTADGVSEFNGQKWYSYKTLTTSLASNFVHTVAIDKAEHKWFGYGERGKGVSVFDGQRWHTYTSQDGLVNDYVYTIAIDKNNHKWFGTAEGVSKFDGQTWTNYTPTDGLVHNFVQSIAVDEKTGHVWFGTQGKGVSKFDGQTWTTYTTEDGLLSNNIRTIVFDQVGHLWFGGSGGVSKFEGISWIKYTGKDGLLKSEFVGGYSPPTGIDVNQIIIDQDGHKWFAITVEGFPKNNRNAAPIVSKFDGQTWTNYDLESYYDNWAIAIDKVGQVWSGAYNGVYKFNGQNWTPYFVKDGLANNNVRAIAVDEAGHLWFGTWGGGVSEFDGQTWTTYTTAGLVDNDVYAIAIDEEENKWFGTAGGVSKFNGQTWTNYTTAHGLVGHNVQAMTIDRQGHIWVGTAKGLDLTKRYGGGGVNEFDGQTWITHSTISGSIPMAITADQTGQILSGMFMVGSSGPIGTIEVFDDQTWTKECNSMGGVLAMAVDKVNHIWVGTYGLSGVVECDGETATIYTEADGLARNHVESIVIDQLGHKWFATDNGVSEFDDHTWKTYTIADGLASNVVYAIAIDETGRKWFGTDNGISVFNDR